MVSTNRCGLLLLGHGCDFDWIVRVGIGVRRSFWERLKLAPRMRVGSYVVGWWLQLTGCLKADGMFDKAVSRVRPWCSFLSFLMLSLAGIGLDIAG